MTDEGTRRADAAKIEEVLADLREQVPGDTWQCIEGALQRIVRLYGTGLERALDHARQSGAVGASFDELLANDRVLANLLVAHGLHPLTTEQRVERALEVVRAELALDAGELVLAKVDEDRVVHLIAAQDVADSALGVIESAAPEVTSIQIASLSQLGH